MSLGLSLFMRKTKRLDPKISLVWLTELLKYILIIYTNIHYGVYITEMSGTEALERDTRRDPEQPASSQQTWTLYCTHVPGSDLNELISFPTILWGM